MGCTGKNFSGYFKNEYDYLTRCLSDGNLGPDNGLVERTIRKFAIGRNNWMFADTPEGADASALLYSLVITAKVNGVNPYTAIKKILTEVPLAQTIEDYERLADFILTPS
ncbi:MAG: transposase [Pseudomonadota bacterium]